MQYEFLNNFPKRMKNVGLYSLLIRNIISKTSWNEFGFEKDDERINLVFSLLLFIMEKSLMEDTCTIDDMAAFIDDLNTAYYQKSISFSDCVRLADFIVNVILSNEGRQISFDGFDYNAREYKTIHIRYVKNQIIYTSLDIKRTSYMLTDDGYNLLLSTLENLQIPIQEMIFRLHLEKQNYDKAVDNIRTIFQTIRMQYQKILDSMQRIRKNALEYSVNEYRETLEENLATIHETKDKFQAYSDLIKQRINEYEESEIQLSKLPEEDAGKLKNLKIIGNYLSMVIEEHQKILSRHMDLKELYRSELESLSQVTLIKRFSLQSELYDRILENPDAIANLDSFFTPLFRSDADKIYNLAYSYRPHKIIRRKNEENLVEDIDFDEEEWLREQEELLKIKRRKYEDSLKFIIDELIRRKQVSLSELKETVINSPELLEKLIPNTDVFKEIMVELIRARHIDIQLLIEERAKALNDTNTVFELNYMLLDLLEEMDKDKEIKYIDIFRIPNADMVIFENVMDAEGNRVNIRCSDIRVIKSFTNGQSKLDVDALRIYS